MKVVQELLGHSTISTVWIFVHIFLMEEGIPVKQQITGLQKMSAYNRIMIVNLAVNKNHCSEETPTNEL